MKYFFIRTPDFKATLKILALSLCIGSSFSTSINAQPLPVNNWNNSFIKTEQDHKWKTVFSDSQASYLVLPESKTQIKTFVKIALKADYINGARPIDYYWVNIEEKDCSQDNAILIFKTLNNEFLYELTANSSAPHLLNLKKHLCE